MPAVNWLLFLGVVLLMLTFRTSARLATAYGVAVTGTLVITTTLFLVVARPPGTGARRNWCSPVWCSAVPN